jgi:D-glycero-alpha-D-manno-heptose-7-phosphate kinase
MIISRAPVRFSLGGGGTDLPAYSEKFGGYVISAAVDKYIYVTANKRFQGDILLKYSQTERVTEVKDIRHRILREALHMTGVRTAIEITSMADVPANTGLGSSSSFTVAVLNALHTYKRNFISSQQLAEEACELEINRLGDPLGKQDQYIAAFGGVTAFTFEKDGTVRVEPVPASEDTFEELQNNLCVFYTGIERTANDILAEQSNRVQRLEGNVVDRMHCIKDIGHEVYEMLVSGKVDSYGELLDDHWSAKRKLASKMTDPIIDECYDEARKAGAIGGKLMGAGGGGFFMFYVRPQNRRHLISVMELKGLPQLRFRFDYDGARIVTNMQRT